MQGDSLSGDDEAFFGTFKPRTLPESLPSAYLVPYPHSQSVSRAPSERSRSASASASYHDYNLHGLASSTSRFSSRPPSISDSSTSGLSGMRSTVCIDVVNIETLLICVKCCRAPMICFTNPSLLYTAPRSRIQHSKDITRAHTLSFVMLISSYSKHIES